MIRKVFIPRSSADAWARTLALVAVVGATLFLMWQSEERDTSNPDAEQLRGPSEPDSFVVGSDYRAFDENGKLEIQLTSPRIEQFEDSNRAELQAPVARVFSDQSPEPWIIKSDEGSLRQTQGLLHLRGNVVVTRATTDGETTLETGQLTLNDNDSTVYTDQPVTITEPYGTTRATGMKAWIDQRILELNSQVEGRYETFR
jgi:lipopolysaccharide export system protein LptC